MNSKTIDCYITNHDLSLTEMLDFGIRFFDFDIYYKSDDQELETGHGPSKWYYTYGKVEYAMKEIQNWMVKHSSEIVVVYFGEILGSIPKAFMELTKILDKTFNGKIVENIKFTGLNNGFK